MFEVNYLAILVAGIATMVIGGLWYSPVLFGNTWIKEMELSDKKMEKMRKMNATAKGMTMAYSVNFITVLITNFTLAMLFDYAGILGLDDALFVAFWIWFGFLLMWQIGGMIWGGASLKLTAINGLYNLISIMLSAAILVSW